MPLSIQTDFKGFQYLEKSYSMIANNISEHFFKQCLISPVAVALQKLHLQTENAVCH